MAKTLVGCSAAITFAVALALPFAAAAEGGPGDALMDAMGFVQNYEESEALCRDHAARTDVEKALADNPELLGGIQPTDPEWSKARALYVDLLQSLCQQDIPALTDAFAQALEASLSVADMDALTAFYRGELGRKFRDASLQGNLAVYQLMMRSESSQSDYAAFGEAIAKLSAAKSPASVPAPAPKAVQALADATVAVAMSDGVMKAIADGRAREALHGLKVHTIAPDAQLDAMLDQMLKQKPVIDASFGESLDYELLRNDTIGDALIRQVFLHRFERGAMIWLFTWYRGKDGWVLNNVRFADDVNLLFR